MQPVVDKFLLEVFKAPRGSTFVYHTGFLSKDRGGFDGEEKPHQRELNLLAGYLMRLAEEGKCHLFQRRLGAGRYEYRVVTC